MASYSEEDKVLISARYILAVITAREHGGYLSEVNGPKPLLLVTLEGPRWYHWILRV